MGDYLLAKSLISATETGDIKIMSILADTAKRLSKGELLQIEKSRKLDITESEYFKMISDKTAALISACCELGAMTVSDQVNEREQLRQFGENLGIAFQIKDDLLDFQGDQIILGKPVGADLKEKKITLPLILSFKNSPEKEKKFILKLIKKGVTNRDINQIYEFIQNYGGLQSARGYALSYAEKAKQTLDLIQNEPAKENALSFVDYVINRKK
jgi:octaprenyl-diphosphate synthase